MSLENYILINLVPFVVVDIIYHDMRKRLVRSSNNKLLGWIMLAILTMLLTDTLGWTLDGNPGDLSRHVLWLADMTYFLLIAVTPYMWLIYTIKRLNGNLDKRLNVRMAILAVPLAVHIVFLALTPMIGTYFTIDVDGVYHRGSFLIVQQIVSMGYMFLTIIAAMLYRQHADSEEKKLECLTMALLLGLPVVLAVFQIAFYGMTLFLPVTALSVVILYLNTLHFQVALDGMTGLNNRRSLDEYLQKRIDRSFSEKGNLYVLLMDINEFKSINDTYGHVEGDRVICLVSVMLKYYFTKTDAFISRYGGDEFAVALNCKSDEIINDLVNRLHEPIKNWKADAGKPLMISVGVAKYDYLTDTTPERLIKNADDRMYTDKQSIKLQAGGTQ